MPRVAQECGRRQPTGVQLRADRARARGGDRGGGGGADGPVARGCEGPRRPRAARRGRPRGPGRCGGRRSGVPGAVDRPRGQRPGSPPPPDDGPPSRGASRGADRGPSDGTVPGPPIKMGRRGPAAGGRWDPRRRSPRALTGMRGSACRSNARASPPEREASTPRTCAAPALGVCAAGPRAGRLRWGGLAGPWPGAGPLLPPLPVWLLGPGLAAGSASPPAGPSPSAAAAVPTLCTARPLARLGPPTPHPVAAAVCRRGGAMGYRASPAAYAPTDPAPNRPARPRSAPPADPRAPPAVPHCPRLRPLLPLLVTLPCNGLSFECAIPRPARVLGADRGPALEEPQGARCLQCLPWCGHEIGGPRPPGAVAITTSPAEVY